MTASVRGQRPSQWPVYLRRGAVDRATCERIRGAMDAGSAEPAEVYADGYVADEAVRRTMDVSVAHDVVRDVERLLEAIRPDVSTFFDVTLRASEGPGFLRYDSGGFYHVHHDVAPGTEFPRRISVVLFLTSAEGEAGGELRLYDVGGAGPEDEPFDIAPEMGTLVAFPSDILHEVLPVRAGSRDVVVDWFY